MTVKTEYKLKTSCCRQISKLCDIGFSQKLLKKIDFWRRWAISRRDIAKNWHWRSKSLKDYKYFIVEQLESKCLSKSVSSWEKMKILKS